MNSTDLTNAYHNFFVKSEAGQQFMAFIAESEASHIGKAQQLKDVYELAVSAGNKEVHDHIVSVIAQSQQ